jgi:ATP-dependent DNA helicase DinG
LTTPEKALPEQAKSLLSVHLENTGGENRPQQGRMVEIVSQAFQKQECTAIVQAGTGTGKSLAYLFPAIASGERTVIATATNQLSEQLYKQDLPEVAESLKSTKTHLSYAILKGRNNYACKAKISEIKSLDDSVPLFTDSDYGNGSDDSLSSSKIQQAKEDSKLVAGLIDWSQETETGDRSDAFPVTDRVWRQISVSSSECPGASNCPMGDVCFTEIARKKAKVADIVITNHALLAQEAVTREQDVVEESKGKQSMFGDYSNLIIDEAHDLPDAITGALTSEISPKEISKLISKVKQYVMLADSADSNLITNTLDALEIVKEELEETKTGQMSTLEDSLLAALRGLANYLMVIHSVISKESAKAAKRDNAAKSISMEILSNNILDIVRLLADAMLEDSSKVKWVEKRSDGNANFILKVAPLEVGNEYREIASSKKVILTSATLTVGGSFEPLKQILGIDSKTDSISEDVGSPFNYPKQGMLYIPKSPFPEPVGKDRIAHTEAVLSELFDLVMASGGRTLALFTTTNAAKNAADYLRERTNAINIYAHGEAPSDVLVQMFKDDESSVLCATMGLWQGTNVPGPSCSLVVIDKVGFAPIDDVLSNARRELANSRGRDGFKEVVVAQAATSLAQAVGRLIRTSSDKGVVAILDPRIHSKQYGRTLLASIPNFGLFTDKKIVTEALERLTGGINKAPQKPDNTLSKSGAPKSGSIKKGIEEKSSAELGGKKKLVRSSYKKNIGKKRGL